jgi:hypothetical protein
MSDKGFRRTLDLAIACLLAWAFLRAPVYRAVPDLASLPPGWSVLDEEAATAPLFAVLRDDTTFRGHPLWYSHLAIVLVLAAYRHRSALWRTAKRVHAATR